MELKLTSWHPLIALPRMAEEEKRLCHALGEGLVNILKEAGAFCAGGAITSLLSAADINDYDIYFPTKEAYLQAFEELLQGCWEAQICHKTNKALLLQVQGPNGPIDVQFVTFMFAPLEEVLKSFDFTVNMVGYSFGSQTFHAPSQYNVLKHIGQRRLVFNPETKHPIVSLSRVQKYVSRGYNISEKEIRKMGLACQQLTLSSWEDVKAQLGGMYGEDVNDLFDESLDVSTALAQLQEYKPFEGSKEKSSFNVWEVFYREKLGNPSATHLPLYVSCKTSLSSAQNVSRYCCRDVFEELPEDWEKIKAEDGVRFYKIAAPLKHLNANLYFHGGEVLEEIG